MSYISVFPSRPIVRVHYKELGRVYFWPLEIICEDGDVYLAHGNAEEVFMLRSGKDRYNSGWKIHPGDLDVLRSLYKELFGHYCEVLT